MLVNLKEKVTKALTNADSELWFPHLTYDLMCSGLTSLYEQTGITEEEYGTGRMVFRDSEADRINIGAIYTPSDSEEIRDKSFIEILPDEITEEYKKSGVDFYTRDELFVHDEITACLKDAFAIIEQVPSLFRTVRFLVKAIHLIKPEDDDYDVSFSKPHIPFSIFVSIPRLNSPINALRVAEAIIHEAMHLNLTLIENVVPLITAGGELVYSPWKDEYRTPQGLLHAVYVFSVVKSFLTKILSNFKVETQDILYIKKRKHKIMNQMEEIKSFANSRNLNALGRNFTTDLIINRMKNI